MRPRLGVVIRVLVTGSRTWRNGALLHEKLENCRLACAATGDTLTVVHGGCTSGADMYANGWARWFHTHSTNVAAPEVHPADWSGPCREQCWPGHRRRPTPETVASRKGLGRGWTVCPRAGMYRNEEMVGLGADLCLAFIVDESRGATHCAWAAERSGIETIRFRAGMVQPELPFRSADRLV